MALFELERGRLIPAQFGRPVAQGLGADIMESVRSQVLEVIDRPLFPVTWYTPEGQVGPEGGPHCLTALDPAGQVVSVEVMQRLDAVTVIAAMSRLGAISKMGWLDLARAYPGGPEAFRAGWAEFRESMPPTVEPGPRLFLVVGDLDSNVDQALTLLTAAGLEIYQVCVRQMSNGRRFLEVAQVAARAFSGSRQIGGHQARPQLEWNNEAEAGAGVQALAQPAAGDGPAAADFTDTAWDGHQDDPAAAPAAEAAQDMPPAANEQAQPAATPPSSPQPQQATTGQIGCDEEGLRTIAQMVGQPTVLLYRDPDYHLFEALLKVDGTIELGQGGSVADPDQAYQSTTGQQGSGWQAWRLGNLEGPTLAEAVAEINSEHR